MVEVIRTKAQLRAVRAKLTGSVGLVMTMGALHEGHLALVKAALAQTDNVIVSIYVNPLQFAPTEDFASYPRDLEADCALLDTLAAPASAPAGVEKTGVVRAVFAPSDAEMYPRQPLVRIDPGPVATRFEGTTRPTHFAGVLQVVHKVFSLVEPDVAFFGQKDAQQLALVRTMVADLDMPLQIHAVPIVRESSGLARSSRNTYLSAAEKTQALALFQALQAGSKAAAAGASPEQTLAATRAVLSNAPGVRIDYAELVDPETLQPLTTSEDSSSTPTALPARGLLILAAYVGPTRLIDNMEVTFHAHA